MKKALVLGAALLYVMLNVGCSCECEVCCGTGAYEVCASTEDVKKADCEDADGTMGCSSACK